MLNENWNAIPGFPAYQASNLGRIRRITPFTRGPRHMRHPGFILKPIRIKSGYLVVNLIKHNSMHQRLVHRLIASAFLGSARNRCVNHLNFRRDDNRLCNLEWTTLAGNNRHSSRHGHYRIGKNHPRPTAKFTEDDVRRIRSLATNTSRKKLAEMFARPITTINQVVSRHSWKHLP